MGHYEDHALEILKANGFRLTKPRRMVLALLEKSTQPLSAYQIKDRLDAEREKIDTVSIYRILETLEANHLIHRILSTGQVSKCAMCCDHDHHHGEGPHHHLLICKTCNTVSEAPCADMAPVVATVEATSHFKVQTHHLEFWGQCAQCQGDSLSKN